MFECEKTKLQSLHIVRYLYLKEFVLKLQLTSKKYLSWGHKKLKCIRFTWINQRNACDWKILHTQTVSLSLNLYNSYTNSLTRASVRDKRKDNSSSFMHFSWTIEYQRHRMDERIIKSKFNEMQRNIFLSNFSEKFKTSFKDK